MLSRSTSSTLLVVTAFIVTACSPKADQTTAHKDAKAAVEQTTRQAAIALPDKYSPQVILRNGDDFQAASDSRSRGESRVLDQ